MPIPFIDLKTQYAAIQSDVEQAVLEVLRSGQYIMGPEVERLEEELGEYVGVSECVSCASGTDALVISLMALGIGPGDAVITSAFTFMASAEAIALVGARPVFADIDPRTFNIDPESVCAIIEGWDSALGKIKAVMPVDIFGLPSDLDEIGRISKMNGLTVIEDAAQSFGATIGKRRAGGMAEIGCTSFFPAKPLGCYGDGGAIFIDDPELAALCRSIRVHGQGESRYEHARLGVTGRLDAIQAAILRVKLKIFDGELEARQRVARTYDRAIASYGIDLTTPFIPAGRKSAFAQYSVLARDAESRTRSMDRLSESEIPTAIYYDKPLHLQEAFAYLGHRGGDLPITEDICARIFSLPMHPYLNDEAIETIVVAMAGEPKGTA